MGVCLEGGGTMFCDIYRHKELFCTSMQIIHIFNEIWTPIFGPLVPVLAIFLHLTKVTRKKSLFFSVGFALITKLICDIYY